MGWFMQLLGLEPRAEAPAPARAGVRGNPIIVNPDDGTAVQIACDRIDAIRRHIEQASRPITPQREREFRRELARHAATLHAAGKIDDEAHDTLVSRVMGS